MGSHGAFQGQTQATRHSKHKTQTRNLSQPTLPFPWCPCGRCGLPLVPSQNTIRRRGQRVYLGWQVLCQACSTHRNQNTEGTAGSRRGVSLRPFGRTWCSGSKGLLSACTMLQGRQRNRVLLGHNVIWSHYNVLYVGHYCSALNMQNFA